MTIFQIYLPSNKQESLKYQRILQQLIKAEHNKYNKGKIIVMGDFNAVSNPERDRSHQKANHNSWKPEIELYNFLED